MIEIEKPNIATVNLSDDGRSGKFIIEPLERGYGTTLGNSLPQSVVKFASRCCRDMYKD